VHRAVLPALLSLSLVACGGAPSSDPAPQEQQQQPPAAAAPAVREAGSAQVQGTVDGQPVTFVDAVVVAGTHGARVLLVDRKDFCEHPGVTHPDARTLTIDLGPHGATSIDTGEYDVPEALDDSSRALNARLDVMGPQCSPKSFMFREGSAHLDDASATRISGKFSITIGLDSLDGSFVATPCAGDQYVDATAAPRCE
jgi:hypothetical protein